MENKVAAIIDILNDRYPQALCALHYQTDYQLMIAVRLSAQCTDARVNMVTPALFEAYPTLDDLANANISDIEGYIHSCGFYRQKAKDIVLSCQMLIRDYDRKVPGKMEELLKLPGVGRKIANLLLGDIYGKPGIVADTHCIRIGGRLGMYDPSIKDPHKVEKILSELVAPEKQSDFCHRIVQFGRDTCSARAPMCETCPLSALCEKQLKSPKK